MSRNSYDINEEQIHTENKIKLLELKGKSNFNKYDIDFLEDRIDDLKKDRTFYFLAGISIGSIVTIVMCHFLK